MTIKLRPARLHILIIPLLSSIGLLAAASPVQASVFRVLPLPLSETALERIPTEQVRFEGRQSFTQWSRALWEQNPSLFDGVSVQPVANIMIDAIEDDMPAADRAQFCDRARAEAAWAGANLIFMVEEHLDSDGELVSARFTAYRAEYQKTLLSPYQLASLARMPLSSPSSNARVLSGDSLGADYSGVQEEGGIPPSRVHGMLSSLTSLASDILTVAVLK
jgi:hypothetical protein